MMPAVSEKQKHLMDAAAHNPAFAKKVGIPTKVAKEFSTASKGQKFSTGGHMATKNNGITTAKMGSVRTAAPSKDGVAVKGKTKGKQVVMSGSKPLGMKNGGMTKKMNYGGKC